MAAADTVQAIIDSALASAQQAQDAADSYSDDAVNAAKTSIIHPGVPDVATLTIPTPPEPSQDLLDLLTGESNSEGNEIKAMIESELADFLNTYFPCGWISKMQSLCNKLHDWIENGGTGLANDVEAGIWDRGRERINRLGEKADDAGAGAAAARGWSIPPASVTRRQMAMDQDEINRDSQYSRDIAIKQAELEQANVHFAISNAISLYTSIMQAALNFVDAKLRAESLGQSYGSLVSQAAQALYSQALQYYRAQIQAEELTLRQSVASSEVELRELSLAIDAIMRRARNQADAAMAGARVMGDIAASARSTTNTMASIASETTTEE